MDTPKKIGRYEILEELGHGAMGMVYRAKDPAMDRIVALKTIISVVLATEQATDFRERFFREARAAGSLTHPGIVPIFDVGEHDGQPFLVMEFVSGKTLADALKRGERLTPDRICEIGQKIAEALGYAHQRGVVHRDIKPANILLTSKEAHGIERPKITDFGVAKLAEVHTTLTGQMLGTPAFMPPEQFTGAPFDGRADIFSLGVVLYWMATGEQPFPGESMTAVSYKVVHTEPVPPCKLNPSIPAKLEAIILKCLVKNPDERYRTGEDLARDLGELRTGSTAVGMHPVASTVQSGNGDPNATFIERPVVAQTGGTMAAALPAAPAAPAVRSNNLVAVAALGILVIGAGSWLLLRHKEPAATQTASPAVPIAPVAEQAAPVAQAPVLAVPGTPKPAAGGTAAAAATTPVAPAAKPVTSAAPKPVTKAAAAPTPAPPVAEPPAPPEPAAVDFNPKSLDPKANARLKIDADHMPVNLDFTLEMNGKVYIHRLAQDNKKEIDDLFVPPGVQEFRVTTGSGNAKVSSNTVSTEFKAKKKHTLKVELRTKSAPQSSAMPNGLYPDSQIVLSLK